MNRMTGWLVLGLALCPAAALAQGVTLADLEGAVVEARVTNDQHIRRDGREFTVQFTQAIRVSFKPEGKIDWSLSPSSVSPKGLKHGPTRKGALTLGEVRKTDALGGGEGLWVFEDGILTTLRTYTKAGGYKRTIAFTRKGDQIGCTAKEVFMREEGAGPPTLRSAVDNAPVTILSYKPASSSCKVIPKKPGA
jgi:hypothetical protein